MADRWREDYLSWGRAIRARHLVSDPITREDAAQIVANTPSILPYGAGRSYGDAPLNPEGRLVDCRHLDRFIAFDRRTGILACEAGVRLADILTILNQPGHAQDGWFLPVTPGTRFATVGGAIANDVHGKNHHRLGTFGCHVLELELARSDGARLTCSRAHNSGLFAATIGGIGLTGLILSASIQLHRVCGLAMEVEDIRFAGLRDFFEVTERSNEQWEYTAAWLDSSATGPGLGRGIFSRARHVPDRQDRRPLRRPRTIPLTPPVSLARPLAIRLFNAVYWRKSPLSWQRLYRSGYGKVLFPLDGIANWNTVFGPRGFYQFQCVIPPAAAPDAIAELLGMTARAGQGSFLTGIKTFGDIPSPGLMSFPMAGTSIALDLPNRGDATRRLLTELENVTVQAGGRIYPAKDAAASSVSFRSGYPRLGEFLDYLDPAFTSALARRLELMPATGADA